MCGERAVTPRAVKRARRALHLVDNAVYSVQRSVATAADQAGKAKLTFGGMDTVSSATGALRLRPGARTAKNPYTR
jgi:hypothetical protein